VTSFVHQLCIIGLDPRHIAPDRLCFGDLVTFHLHDTDCCCPDYSFQNIIFMNVYIYILD
tara:strand:- start:14 stop:193 length:180 start_codon:yes stop_codon:yes gene_type:complete